jgi:hypothetical protein
MIALLPLAFGLAVAALTVIGTHRIRADEAGRTRPPLRPSSKNNGPHHKWLADFMRHL